MTSTALVVDPAVACMPTVNPTELTVPVIGLTIVAWLSCCWATATRALAASTPAWSAASWAPLTAPVVEPAALVLPPALAAEGAAAGAVPVPVPFPAEADPAEAGPDGAVPEPAVPAEAEPAAADPVAVPPVAARVVEVVADVDANVVRSLSSDVS